MTKPKLRVRQVYGIWRLGTPPKYQVLDVFGEPIWFRVKSPRSVGFTTATDLTPPNLRFYTLTSLAPNIIKSLAVWCILIGCRLSRSMFRWSKECSGLTVTPKGTHDEHV